VLSHRRSESTGARLDAEAAFVLATAVLLDEGIAYADLSVEQIARKAGRSRSTFYFYFRDKRDLLLRATREIDKRLYAAATGWLTGSAGSGDVRDAVEAMFSIYREHPGLLCAVVEASGYDARVREQWRDLMGRFIAATERRLLAQEGLLGDSGASAASVRARAFALVWMTERCCYQHLSGGGVEHDENLIDALTEIWRRSTDYVRGASGPALPEDAREPTSASPGAPTLRSRLQ
jgi:AcrR family transcriptional regulator